MCRRNNDHWLVSDLYWTRCQLIRRRGVVIAPVSQPLRSHGPWHTKFTQKTSLLPRSGMAPPPSVPPASRRFQARSVTIKGQRTRASATLSGHPSVILSQGRHQGGFPACSPHLSIHVVARAQGQAAGQGRGFAKRRVRVRPKRMRAYRTHPSAVSALAFCIVPCLPSRIIRLPGLGSEY